MKAHKTICLVGHNGKQMPFTLKHILSISYTIIKIDTVKSYAYRAKHFREGIVILLLSPLCVVGDKELVIWKRNLQLPEPIISNLQEIVRLLGFMWSIRS